MPAGTRPNWVVALICFGVGAFLLVALLTYTLQVAVLAALGAGLGAGLGLGALGLDLAAFGLGTLKQRLISGRAAMALPVRIAAVTAASRGACSRGCRPPRARA